MRKRPECGQRSAQIHNGPSGNRAALSATILETITDRIRFSDLPDDLQQLIVDFVSLDDGAIQIGDLPDFTFVVHRIPVASFPVIGDLGDSGGQRGRDEDYSMMIPLDIPVLVVGKGWVDGRHRIWKARKMARKTVPAIDLAEVGVTRVVNALGFLR